MCSGNHEVDYDRVGATDYRNCAKGRDSRMSQTRGIRCARERLELIIRKDYPRGTCCGAMGRAGFGIDVGLAYLPSRISFAAPDGIGVSPSVDLETSNPHPDSLMRTVRLV
jgi:hypothetical protein